MTGAREGLFAGLDPAAVDRVAEMVGTRMAAANALATTTLAHDPTISPAWIELTDRARRAWRGWNGGNTQVDIG